MAITRDFQIAFRVGSKERTLIRRAARLSGRTTSEWARLVTITEAGIQVDAKGSIYPPAMKGANQA